MSIELEIEEIPRLGDGVEREIVGIVQEALTNAVRHSRARRITIRAATAQSVGVRLSIADDGRGMVRDAAVVRLRHDEHAGARRSHRRIADHRDGPAQRHRDRPRLGSVGAADTGACRQLTAFPVVSAFRRTAESPAKAGHYDGATTARAGVLLVDDHALFRTGVAKIINQEPDLRVVAEAGNGVDAVDAYVRHRPDVTLLDLRMPVMEGVEVVRRIREHDPAARVIVLTTYDTDDEISQALKAGAKAYALKDITAEQLVGCIRDVLAGKTYIAPAAAAKLAETVTRVQLTPRELSALRLLADGKANKEIASELDISERTVKTHLEHLFAKLGVTSRTEAVKIATRRGLVRLQ